MSNPFFERPIVNSPYEYPRQHWELDPSGQPTGRLVDKRRRAEFITPIPKPKKRKGKEKQEELVLDEGLGLTTKTQAYDLTSIINEVRSQVDAWRNLALAQWQSPRRLHGSFSTGAIMRSAASGLFLPGRGRRNRHLVHRGSAHTVSGKKLLENLKAVNAEANPHIERLALKLATGAGKTTVMAMLIAWQTLTMPSVAPAANTSRAASSSSRLGSRSRTACAFCNPTIPTTTTAPASWSLTTCSRT